MPAIRESDPVNPLTFETSAAGRASASAWIAADLRLASNVRVPVLITAESRDDRQRNARLIHVTSDVARGPFVTFSSGAAADEGDRANVVLQDGFEHARGGTLFIDDIDVLPADTQALLVSLLEDGVPPQLPTFQCVEPHVRVIAGASRHLDDERATGAFCEPLFYRLNIIHIDLMDRVATARRTPKSQ